MVHSRWFDVAHSVPARAEACFDDCTSSADGDACPLPPWDDHWLDLGGEG